MQIQCPSCKRQYSIDGSKITEQGVKINCPACKHQFIMRRKAEDKPRKPEAPAAQPQRKTPACAVCGAPSTHVFRGPPPRPLCEAHYKIENEKETRFFESDAPPAGKAAPPDPGRTVAPPAARPTPPPPPQQHMPGMPSVLPPSPSRNQDPGRTSAAPRPAAANTRVSEPSFDDFDDFDFSDLDNPGTSRPGTSMSGISNPGFSDPGLTRSAAPPPARPSAKPAPKAPAPGGGSILASNFEFMDDLATANAAPPEPPPEDDGEVDPFRPEPAEADPFRPGPVAAKPPAGGRTAVTPPVDDDDPFKPGPAKPAARPARAAAPMPTADEMPDFAPDPGDEDEGFGGPHNKPSQFNLDGSAAAPSEDGGQEDDFDFKWDEDKKKPSRLEQEIEKPKAKGPAAPVVRPPTRADYEAVRLVKARGSGTSMAAAIFLLVAMAGAVFLSLSGRASQVPTPVVDSATPAVSWVGRLQAPGESAVPDSSSLPSLQVNQDGAGADDNAQRALQQALRDTPAGYESAIASIDAALAADPGNGRYQAIKVDILAFREGLAAAGKPGRAGVSAQALAEASGTDPLLNRAKAHVFLNDNKTAAATALLNNYLAENPQDGIAMFILAMATKYQPEPDPSAAARFLEQAVALEPGLARGYWELAALYREMGQFKAAIETYNKLLTSFPDHEGTAEAMEETRRQQKGVGPGTDLETPSITINPQAPAEVKPQGIAASGDDISGNILDAIRDVEPKLRRVTPNQSGPATSRPGVPGGQPIPGQLGGGRPAMPKPPEEAQ